nr:immunoglobulin light chain junction region [Macaca mulatta]
DYYCQVYDSFTDVF